jgi:UDP-N-acetylglucosamine--dolichyl-phosphate N-acetylglucosaminephosphotransferase
MQHTSEEYRLFLESFWVSIATFSVVSIIGGWFTWFVLDRAKERLKQSGLKGKDLNKPGQPEIPESAGLIPSFCFLMISFILLPVPFVSLRSSMPGMLPIDKLLSYMSALLSIACMILLGFVDDVLNLPWRHKFFFPALASLPILMVYYSTGGNTNIALPKILQSFSWFDSSNIIDLGVLYYIFMAMLAIFCTNAINILAGVNGLEAGQSFVIALSLLLNNLYNIIYLPVPYLGHLHHHSISCILLLPFICVTFPLLYMNWYPASVFVGDTFCYFAGMTFAVVGIHGHYSKTLLLFFLPQIFNFIYSVPQLFGLVPCPRHRLPRLNPKTNKLDMSMAAIPLNDTRSKARIGRFILRILAKFHLICIESSPPHPHQLSTLSSASEKKDLSDQFYVNNMTLINLVLYWGGPTSEATLTKRLLYIQILSSLLAFWMRYIFATMFYGAI